MKLRQWEIEQHLTALLGKVPQAFWAGRETLLLWHHYDGLGFMQRGHMLAVSVNGIVSPYFNPCLDKVSDDSVAAAKNIIFSNSGELMDKSSACEQIAALFEANNEAKQHSH